MTYALFRDSIRKKLAQQPDGLTWAELRIALRLPYELPCPTWVQRLEQEIGLLRVRDGGPAKRWRLAEV